MPSIRTRGVSAPARRGAARLGWALLLVAAARSAPALDPGRRLPEYVRTTWREELPQAAVLALHQTPDGYLWLGTYEGLVRFDGVEFEVFDRRNVPGLLSSNVLCIAGDPSGGLWFGTSRGGAVRMKGGRYEFLTREHGLPSNAVHGLHFDRAGSLWIGTDRGVSRWRGGRLETFGEGAGFGKEIVGSFAETPDGTLWASGTRLRAFRDGAWRDVDLPAGAVTLPATALHADADGSLWIGSISGVARLGAHGTRSWRIGEGVAGGWVRSLGTDVDGSLWVGTEGHGLFRLRGERIEAFSPVVEENATDFVLAIREDREGSLWLGTRGGLIRLRGGAFVAVGADQGLVGELARTVFQDSRGRIWIGTDGGGLHLYEDGRVVPMNERLRISSRRVRSIGEDASGALWVGTSGAGVFRLAGGRTERLGVPEGLVGDDVRAVLGTRDGRVWIGTRTGLTSFRRGVAEPPDRFTTSAGGVNVLLEGRDGALYVGTAGRGLLVRRDGATTAHTAVDGLAGNAVFALHEDSSGAIWIGTADGLSRLEGGRVVTVASDEALARDQVFSILDDGAGALWMSNNKGVYRFPLDKLEAVARGAGGPIGRTDFGMGDGMPSRQCNGTTFPAAARTRDGRLWFATARGVAIVDPARLPAGLAPPDVVVKGAVADGVRVSADSPLVLGPRARRLEIDFASPALAVPERISYRFRLRGFDDAWRTSRRRFAEFTALPPGTFAFEACAVTDDGLRSPGVTTLEVRVRPHLTQTLPFRALALLSVLLAAYAAHRFRVRRLAAQERRLNVLVAEKTEALALANTRLEELSLADGLTGIANRRQYDRRIEEEWKRCQRLGFPIAAILFDVDSFKAYNDSLGHPAGDECLKRVASALADRLRRAGDLVARYGGEEFVALLPATAAADAFVLAEEIRARVESLGIPHPASGVAPVVTVSAGVAAIVPDEGAPDRLTAAADSALYEAKRRGRNRSVLAAEGEGDATPRPRADPEDRDGSPGPEPGAARRD